jgi:Secretory lipase
MRMGKPTLHRIGVTLAALAAFLPGAISVGPAMASGPVVPPVVPEEDPFYTPPGSYAKKAPGTVLRARRIPLNAKHASVISGSIADAAAAYELLYRTTDASGQPTATVATLLIPANPSTGSRRLVAEGVPEDSETQKCAPSYTLRLATAGGVSALTARNVSAELAHGWDVVVTDYEGPQSDLVVGPIEGQATLDAVRAAERFNPGRTGLEGSSTEVALLGYSGGSVPTVWGDALAPTYARDVNLVAAAAGGIPANLGYVIDHAEGSPYFGAVIDALVSIDRSYPELNPYPLLDEKGLEVAASDGSDAKGCGVGIVAVPGGTAKEYTNYATLEELTALPQVRTVLAKLDLTAPSQPVPAAPTYLYNSAEDAIFELPQAEAMAARFCAGGDPVDFQRGSGTHQEGAVKYFTPALSFIEARFAGANEPDTCEA